MSYGTFWGDIPVIVEDELLPVGPSTFRRSLGLRPDVTTIYLAEQQLVDLGVTVPANAERFAFPSQDAPPFLADFMSTGSPAASDPYEGLPYRADLVFAADLVDAANDEGFFPQRRTVVKDLFFNGLRVVGGDMPNRILEITLVDVRAFFEFYGEITRRWNERLPSGLNNFTRRSLREDGTPSSVRQLVQDCLDQLPGRLQVVQSPRELFEPDVGAWGANPRDVIEGVLEAYGWVFSLDLAGTVSLYEAGLGGVGETLDGRGDNAGWDPEAREGIWAGEVIEDRYTFRAPADLPQEVRVVGGPSVFTVATDFATPVIPVERLNPENGQAERRWLEVDLPNLRQHLAPDGSLNAAGAEVFMRLPLSDPAIQGRIERAQQAPDFLGRTEREQLELEQASERREAAARFATVDETELRKAKRNLGRYWQVPPELQALLPVLDRAERFPDGSRMPPYAEACATEPRKVDITASVQVQAQAIQDATLLGARQQLQLAKVQLARIENRIRELELLDLPEIKEFLRGALQKRAESGQLAEDVEAAAGFLGVAGRPELLLFQALDTATGFSDGAAALARDLVEPDSLPVTTSGPAPDAPTSGVVPYNRMREPYSVQTSRGEVQIDRVLDSLKRYGMRLARTFVSFDELTDVKDAVVGVLKSQAEEQKRLILQLQRQVDPVAALQLEIADLRKKQGELERPAGGSVGVADLATRRQIREKEAQIVAAQREAENRSRFEGPFYKLVQTPIPRRATPARVVDRQRGVFELEQPAFWVNDLISENLAEAVAVFMPVRLVFGTTNEPSGQAPELSLNPFIQAAVEQLAEDPVVGQAFGQLGHVLPTFEGGNQLAFTFSLEDPDSGRAEVGPAPYRVVIPDLRLLVELGGRSNYQEQLIRARAAARAVLGLPADPSATRAAGGRRAVGQRDGGSITVIDPRRVNCNGRVTAVEISCDGSGIRTRVAFDSEALPLPGIENPVRASRPLRLRFGLDPESFA